MLPPPSQPRPLPPSRRTQAEPSLTRSQRHDKSFLDEANETTNVSFSRYDSTGAALTTFDLTSNPERPSMIAINSFDEDDDTSYASSCDLSIGPPPALPWALHDLTKLDQLRNRYASLTSSTITTGVTVSVLGVITSVDSRETANSRVTELVLEDDTGANAKLVAWGNPGIELAQALRTGDVVFFGKLRLYRSNYSSNLELKLVEHTSQVGIAYRTRVFDSQDALYTFHENWAQEFGQARAVWDIVAWWNRHREHDFS
ncbi:OB-fold nucleic acid binding domain-containing protein [Sporobolomyces koalae]|uniref:OB-fold nucleic acid binding domain-containing protein n=1 Tax=Sporobolomyces koalae TaxID=500713 RepID=UPI00317F4A94